MNIQGITIEVSDLTRSKDFYERILGFEPGRFYEPTKWQPYQCGGQYFAIREVERSASRDDYDITNFEMSDVESFWQRVKDDAVVVDPLEKTPWGTYKFVIKDPDGYRLGFVASSAG
ncbi:MAG: VOC family protein [Frankiaceae bacterium]